MIGSRDFGNILSGKLPCSAVDQMPHISSINEENFISSVAKLSVGFIAAQEPQAGGDLRIQKQLGRQVDDAIHQAGFKQFFADVSFTGCFGSQCTFSQNKTGLAAGA